ncbi:hypothetical protein ACQKCU_20670 [Heyndrickxia sporothermodurans]
MFLKEDIVTKLEKVENLLENLEVQFTMQIQQERDSIYSKAQQSQAVLESKLKRLEKKIIIKRFSHVEMNKLTFKYQRLG